MDNITHTLLGLALARGGVARLGPFCGAAVVVGANLPDLDVVSLAAGQPGYLIHHRGITHSVAGMIGAAYSVPASIFRAYGGVLSDRVGARAVMYWSLAVSAASALVLSLPPTNSVMRGIKGDISFHFEIGVLAFIVVTFVLGFFMSLGKAAVYKHIPVYYPDHVGSVGGVVGLVGGLGGFVLPILFGLLNDLTGVWQSCFMALFAVSLVSLVWMHLAIRAMEKGVYGICRDCGEPIAPARLNAIPWTRVCITCKEKQSA